MKLETIKKLVAISSLVTLLPLTAFADSTLENFTPSAGALSINDIADVAFTAVAVSTAAQGISVAGVGASGVNPIDTRGTLVGYSITLTSTNVTKSLADIDVSGTAVADGRIAFGGAYTCVNTHATNAASRYRVQVTTAGAVDGTAKFKWLSPADVETAGVTAAAATALDSGVTANFVGAQTLGDVVAKRVGCVKYTSITETPATLTSNSGSTSGLSLGAAALFAGAGATSGANTIFTAEVGSGGGDFLHNVGLAGTFRANGLTGIHTGTLTFTIA